MAEHRYPDPYEWQLVFPVDQDSDSAAGDPPKDSQLKAGYGKGTLIIDYKATADGAAPAGSLLLQFWNGKAAAYTDGISTPIQTGSHRIKLDVHGSPIGLKLANLTDIIVNWVYAVIDSRESTGN